MKLLDTRNKIAATAAGPEAVCIRGFFDPLLAGHVRLLAQHRVRERPLVVRIVDPPDPLLPRADRARVVAALSMVDRVDSGARAEGFIFDAEIREEFLRRVRRRTP